MRFLDFSILLSTIAAPMMAQSPQPKMGAPVSGLTALELQRFDDGKVDFANVFDVAQGLGPIFNQISCANCHNNPVGGSGGTTVTRFGYDDGKGTFDPLVAIGGSLLQAGAIDPAVGEVIPVQANVTALPRRYLAWVWSKRLMTQTFLSTKRRHQLLSSVVACTGFRR